jgi:hypothetical protein
MAIQDRGLLHSTMLNLVAPFCHLAACVLQLPDAIAATAAVATAVATAVTTTTTTITITSIPCTYTAVARVTTQIKSSCVQRRPAAGRKQRPSVNANAEAARLPCTAATTEFVV